MEFPFKYKKSKFLIKKNSASFLQRTGLFSLLLEDGIVLYEFAVTAQSKALV